AVDGGLACLGLGRDRVDGEPVVADVAEDGDGRLENGGFAGLVAGAPHGLDCGEVHGGWLLDSAKRYGLVSETIAAANPKRNRFVSGGFWAAIRPGEVLSPCRAERPGASAARRQE